MKKRVAFNVVLILLLSISILNFVLSLHFFVPNVKSYFFTIKSYLELGENLPTEYLMVLFKEFSSIVNSTFTIILCCLLLFRTDGYKLLFGVRESFQNFMERSNQKKSIKLKKQRKKLEAKLNKINERQSDE